MMRRAQHIAFIVALLSVSVLAVGCNMLDFDGCNDPPDAPAVTAFVLPDVGTAEVRGPDGRLHMSAHFVPREAPQWGYVRLAGSSVASMQMFSTLFRGDTVNVGEQVLAQFGYFSPPAVPRGEGGPGHVRVILVEDGRIAVTFAACVRQTDSVLGVHGPWRRVRGVFHVAVPQ